ncbi:MAG: S-layer homology domain-containing protein [Negativicoccus succinicivorans]|nr:S-layer homology domain-containing protein [Negativicoccus succinicivorans]
MKLKSATLLLALAGMVSAQAAQPFSDVTPQDWAYQAVQQLAAEGIIEGYPDQTFRGERRLPVTKWRNWLLVQWSEKIG